MFLSKLPNVVVQMYLSKLPNVCICPNSQMFLSKFPNVLVQIANCICPNCQITKCVQCVQKNVRQKESRVGRMEGEGGRGGRHRLVLLQPPSLLPLPLSLLHSRLSTRPPLISHTPEISPTISAEFCQAGKRWQFCSKSAVSTNVVFPFMVVQKVNLVENQPSRWE